MSEAAPSQDRPPPQVLSAGVLVGVEALLSAWFAFALVGQAVTGAERVGPVIAQGVLFLIVTAALAAITFGLVSGRRGARTPAIVVQLLLLPVVYTLLGPSRQVLLGLAAGVLVASCLALLLGRAAKSWALDPHVGPTSNG